MALLAEALLAEALLVKDVQPLAHHGQPPARIAAGGLEHREGFGRQALLERQPGPRVDVQPVALPPDGQARVPLVHHDVGADPQQALGQAESAQAAPGHRHPKNGHPPDPGEDWSPSWICGGFGSRPYFCTSMTFSGVMSSSTASSSGVGSRPRSCSIWR